MVFMGFRGYDKAYNRTRFCEIWVTTNKPLVSRYAQQFPYQITRSFISQWVSIYQMDWLYKYSKWTYRDFCGVLYVYIVSRFMSMQ